MDDLEEKIYEETGSRIRSNGSWIGALVLIFVGIIFLLKELGLPLVDNWWALFLVIPAVGCFGSAWNTFHKHENQFTSGVMGSLIGGFILTLLMAIFLLKLEWSYMWPVILIVIGILIFISSFLRRG